MNGCRDQESRCRLAAGRGPCVGPATGYPLDFGPYLFGMWPWNAFRLAMFA